MITALLRIPSISSSFCHFTSSSLPTGRRSSRRRDAANSQRSETHSEPPPMTDGPPVPAFARPFVGVESPSDTSTPAWMNAQQLKYSKVLFAKRIAAHPVLVAQTLHNMPQTGIPQVAFVGKSNVGKSSLINALMYGKQVARTSATPGRTRHLFTFDLGDHLSLIDLPGYGGARVSKELRTDWAVLIDEYFNNSKLLERVVSLVDGVEGPTDLDLKIWEMLVEKEVQFQVVLTKVDRLDSYALHSTVAAVLAHLQSFPSCWPFVHCVSARDALGLCELRASLAAVAADGRRREGKRLVKPTDTCVRDK
eukprot:GHVS01035430.1.p1 GENE.GHVS01035430.1~~GHVS01035430.1.p1  ORF type:complete len:308 (+),score=51.06 GHVS01035430.1:45-968(+)